MWTLLMLPLVLSGGRSFGMSIWNGRPTGQEPSSNVADAQSAGKGGAVYGSKNIWMNTRSRQSACGSDGVFLIASIVPTLRASFSTTADGRKTAKPS